jgi:hypothetical protein
MKYPQHGKFNPKLELDRRRVAELNQEVRNEKMKQHYLSHIEEYTYPNESKLTLPANTFNSDKENCKLRENP